MRGKRGWIRILEATIAVMIVSGVMISVYSDQSVREDITVSDYSYSLQKEILSDVALQTDLRLSTLAVVDDFPGDPNYDVLNSFVNDSIPDSFGYLLRVCDLGDTTDFCKMDSAAFIATLDKDVFVEEIVVSAELGNGTDKIYSPKKVRLFFWEGGLPEDFCRDECSAEGVSLVCSADSLSVLSSSCIDTDGDGCLNSVGSSVNETCGISEVCVDAECIFSAYSKWTCERRDITVSGDCVHNFDDECINAGYDGGQKTGTCGVFDDEYECWNIVNEVSACSDSPSCSAGYDFVSAVPCVGTCTDSCGVGDCGYHTICGASIYCGSCGVTCMDTCVASPDACFNSTAFVNETCEPDVNGCLDDAPVATVVSCGSGEVCQAGSCVGTVPSIASLSASYVLGSEVGDDYYYNVTLSELNGVTVNIDSGERCFSTTGNCYPYSPSFVIFGSGQALRSNQHFTSSSTNIVTYTYSGTDVNNNDVNISFSISTDDY